MLVCGNGSRIPQIPYPLNFQWFSAQEIPLQSAIRCREMSEELLLPTIVSYSFAVDTCEKAQRAGHGSWKLMWQLLKCDSYRCFEDDVHPQGLTSAPKRRNESSISFQGAPWVLGGSWMRRCLLLGKGSSLVWWNGFCPLCEFLVERRCRASQLQCPQQDVLTKFRVCFGSTPFDGKRCHLPTWDDCIRWFLFNKHEWGFPILFP